MDSAMPRPALICTTRMQTNRNTKKFDTVVVKSCHGERNEVSSLSNKRADIHLNAHRQLSNPCKIGATMYAYAHPHEPIHARTHTRTHTRTHARTHSYARARTHTRAHARTHACTHAQRDVHSCLVRALCLLTGRLINLANMFTGPLEQLGALVSPTTNAA